MFGSTRRSPFEDLFNFQREIDRVFNQFWSDLPTRMAATSVPGGFQVHTKDEGWQIDVPLPGVDPQHVSLEVAGNTLSIRAEVPGEGRGNAGNERTNAPVARYEQTLTIPQFLDTEKISASHRHGLLQLTLPLKESVKPRRVEIATEEQKRLAA